MNAATKWTLGIIGGGAGLWYLLTKKKTNGATINKSGSTPYASTVGNTGSVSSALPALFDRAQSLGTDIASQAKGSGLSGVLSSLGLGGLTSAGQGLSAALNYSPSSDAANVAATANQNEYGVSETQDASTENSDTGGEYGVTASSGNISTPETVDDLFGIGDYSSTTADEVQPFYAAQPNEGGGGGGGNGLFSSSPSGGQSGDNLLYSGAGQGDDFGDDSGDDGGYDSGDYGGDDGGDDSGDDGGDD